jgi:septal ring factor EnvC (AmiA/AmiB activator)
VSDEKIGLELLGLRVLAITAGLRDLQLRLSALEQRFTAMEARFTALESRFGAQEDRMAAMLLLLVRVAQRIGTGSP